MIVVCQYFTIIIGEQILKQLIVIKIYMIIDIILKLEIKEPVYYKGQKLTYTGG